MPLHNTASVLRYGVCAPQTLIENQSRDPQLYLSCNSDNNNGFIDEVLTSELYLRYKRYSKSNVRTIRNHTWDVLPDTVLNINNPTHCSIDCKQQLNDYSASVLSGCFIQDTNPFWGKV